MARHVLKLDQDDDFAVIGISCHEKDYRICWRVNKACRLELERQEPDPLYPDISSIYAFCAADDQINYKLIANRNEQGLLLPEFKNLDYFLTMSDPHHEPVTEVLSRIRSINNVLAAYELDVNEQNLREKLAVS